MTSLRAPSGFSSSRTISLNDAITLFLEHCRITRRLSCHTVRAYQLDLRDFSRYFGVRRIAAAVSQAQIREYARYLVDEKKLKESSTRRRLASLRILYSWLAREKRVSTNPFQGLDLSIKMPRYLPRALDRRSLLSLLTQTRAECRSHDGLLLHLIVAMLIATGLRISELVTARSEDLSLSERSLRVLGKGSRDRIVFLAGDELLTILERFAQLRTRLNPRGSTFLVDSFGNPISTQYVRRRLRRVVRRAGIAVRVTPHILRHTAATQLLEAGVDIRCVQRLLGHSSIATTQLYTEVNDVALKRSIMNADVLGVLQR